MSMSAALALILLAEAATACAPPQLPGGATVIRPVGKAEPVPFERLGPATSVPRSDDIHQTAADKDEEPDAEASTEQCNARPVHFV